MNKQDDYRKALRTLEDWDVRWIMKQNLSKKRLARMDAEWVAACQAQLDAQHR
jgi:hypothetical protein